LAKIKGLFFFFACEVIEVRRSSNQRFKKRPFKETNGEYSNELRKQIPDRPVFKAIGAQIQ
jgi:hypothetical protein